MHVQVEPLPLARQRKPVPACLQALSNESLSSTSWPVRSLFIYLMIIYSRESCKILPADKRNNALTLP